MENIQTPPFISIIEYGTEEYVGIIINQDIYVTSFYNIDLIKTRSELKQFMEIGEIWWYESSRSWPISIFCRDLIKPFDYIIMTLNTKDVKIITGPTVNIGSLTGKKNKRRSIQVIKT